MPDKHNTLKLYGQYSRKIAELLKEGEMITEEDRAYIENHLLIIQLSLTASKYAQPKGRCR